MIIAHDLGTSGNKASLHDEAGRVLATCTTEYPTHYAPDGVAEQDPDDWWRAVSEATRRLLSQAGVAGSRIQAVALSGQMMGAVFLDGDYRPVRPAFIWADQRSVAQARRLVQAVGQESAYARLGHRINCTYTLPKAMWVKEMEPEAWARTRHVCVAKDFVTARLTGVLVTDPSDASSTDAYDLNNHCWSPRMLAAAGIDLELLPEVVPSTTVVGGLTADAAESVGLPIGTPVVVGGGDGPMASVGAGAITPVDGAYVCLGSSAWVAFSAEKPLIDPLMRSFTFEHIVPPYYSPTATMQAGGACLHWLADLLEPGGGAERFARLLAETSTEPAARDGLFFLPYLLGERSPHWNPTAAGSFLGLARHHGRGEIVRAVLEGVAFNLRTCLEAFRENGVSITQLDVIGGGATSDEWLGILANVWGIPVRRRSITDEANSLGAAVTAMVGVGLADFSLARTLSTVTAEFEPDPDLSAEYAERHRVFVDAYERLEPWFETRHHPSVSATHADRVES
jgi:xylulokinase